MATSGRRLNAPSAACRRLQRSQQASACLARAGRIRLPDAPRARQTRARDTAPETGADRDGGAGGELAYARIPLAAAVVERDGLERRPRYLTVDRDAAVDRHHSALGEGAAVLRGCPPKLFRI